MLDQKLLEEFRKFVQTRKITSTYELPLHFQQKIFNIVRAYPESVIYLTGSFVKGWWTIGGDKAEVFRKTLWKKDKISDLDLVIVPYVQVEGVDVLKDNEPKVKIYENFTFY